MSTYNAFYVRRKAPEKVTRTAILSLSPRAEIRSFTNFIGAVLSSEDFEPAEQKLSELSSKLATDVLWVGYQTASESFRYHHWQNGSQLRALVYGWVNEGKWERVEGKAEPWEEECFWDEESLDMNLEEAKSAAERKKLKKLWEGRLLIKGAVLPVAGSDIAAEAVMEHYGFGY